MHERDILVTDVLEVFTNKFLEITRGDLFIIGKTKSGKILTLVVNRKESKLITLWPSSRQERRLYEEKIT